MTDPLIIILIVVCIGCIIATVVYKTKADAKIQAGKKALSNAELLVKGIKPTITAVPMVDLNDIQVIEKLSHMWNSNELRFAIYYLREQWLMQMQKEPCLNDSAAFQAIGILKGMDDLPEFLRKNEIKRNKARGGTSEEV